MKKGKKTTGIYLEEPKIYAENDAEIFSQWKQKLTDQKLFSLKKPSILRKFDKKSFALKEPSKLGDDGKLFSLKLDEFDRESSYRKEPKRLGDYDRKSISIKEPKKISKFERKSISLKEPKIIGEIDRRSFSRKEPKRLGERDRQNAFLGASRIRKQSAGGHYGFTRRQYKPKYTGQYMELSHIKLKTYWSFTSIRPGL